MIEKFILFLIVLNPAHELNKNPNMLSEMAGYFNEVGEKYDWSEDISSDEVPSLLAYWVYREASYDEDSVGTRGEVGLAQVHGKSRTTCEAAGLDVKSKKGGIQCLALLLDMGRRYCGSLESGARYVASGSCHIAKKKIAERFGNWRKNWYRVKNDDYDGNSERLKAWRTKLKRMSKDGVFLTGDFGG